MSTASFALPISISHHTQRSATALPKAKTISRRPTRVQGQALEALGHAIEYLIDSQMRRLDSQDWIDDGDAIRLLSGLSRVVFNECSPSTSIFEELRAASQRLFQAAFDRPTAREGSASIQEALLP